MPGELWGLRTPKQGADTIIWLAVAESVASTSGRFWLDRRERGTHLLPGTRSSAQDRRRLWDECVRLSGLAERAAYHPEWSKAYNRIVVGLTANEARGITQKDLDLAREMDDVAGRM